MSSLAAHTIEVAQSVLRMESTKSSDAKVRIWSNTAMSKVFTNASGKTSESNMRI